MVFHKNLHDVGWDKVRERQAARIPLVWEWIDLTRMRNGSSVLDIGPGPGLFTVEYAKVVGNEGAVFALEQSQDAISYLAAECRNQNLSNISIIHCNAEEMQNDIPKFEIAMVTDVLHHAESPSKILNNLYWQARKESIVLIAEFDPLADGRIGPPLGNRISPNALKQLAEVAGFKDIQHGKQDYEHYYFLMKI